MTATKQIRDKWKDLSTHGDYERIAKISGLNWQTIRNCMNGKQCTPETFTAVAQYYEQVENLINSFT